MKFVVVDRSVMPALEPGTILIPNVHSKLDAASVVDLFAWLYVGSVDGRAYFLMIVPKIYSSNYNGGEMLSVSSSSVRGTALIFEEEDAWL